MDYKDIKRLTELVSEYRWDKENGLIVFIDYPDCKEVFSEICPVHSEIYPDCTACEDCIAVPNFEKFLGYYTAENIEDIFPKED